MELSIVIPTFNRSGFLQKTLQSVSEQNSANILFEVIVVDNGSTDETASVCKSAEQFLSNFTYHYDNEPGQLTGRHKGIELSKGKIISFIDDDVELSPEWVRSIVEIFNEKSAISIVGGPCLPKYHQYPPSWIQHFWQDAPHGGSMCLPLSLIDLGQNNIEVDPLFIFGLNYSIRKSVLLELGGFHPDCIPQHLQKYQGDGETGLSLKARNRGLKAMYVSSALLYHQVPGERTTIKYFEKWYFYNGVCQSFTDIRTKYGLNIEPLNAAMATGRFSNALIKTGKVLKQLIRKSDGQLPEEIKNLQSCFQNKYLDGYRFHQSSFYSDETVKDWV